MSILAALPANSFGEPGLVALPSIVGQLCQTIIDSIIVGRWATGSIASDSNTSPQDAPNTLGKPMEVVPGDIETKSAADSSVQTKTSFDEPISTAGQPSLSAWW